MASEIVVCLIKDLPVDKGGYVYPTSNYITWDGNPGDNNKASSLRSLGDCIKKLKNATRDILCLLTRLEKEEMQFYIFIYQALADELFNALPKPFLQIKCREHASPTNADNILFEKRLDLTELSEKAQIDKWIHKVCSSRIPNSAKLLFDINVGWSEELSIPAISDSQKFTQINFESFIQRLFEKDSSKDMTVVAGNGAEISQLNDSRRCPKMYEFFTAHSDVISAMISPNNGIQESRNANGRIEMLENSEVGLTHLMRYLYGMKLNIDEISCEVAIELFKTAHKYKLIDLLKWLCEILSKKGSDWFTPDNLVELYFHMKNLVEFKAMEEHLICIMLCLPMEIRECERFKELTRTDAVAAIELLSVLFDKVNVLKK